MSVDTKKTPLFEEIKEQGVPMEDTCDFCNDGNSLMYMLIIEEMTYVACDKCESVFE